LTLERDRKYFYYVERVCKIDMRVQGCLLLAAAGGLIKLQAGAADGREIFETFLERRQQQQSVKRSGALSCYIETGGEA